VAVAGSIDDMLVVDGVSHHFGGIAAIDACQMSVQRGTISALIGPNGAGKSTLLNVISGSLPLQKGQVRLNGHDIGHWAPHRIARRGLIRTFQVARDFEKLTVIENMLVAPQNQPGESPWVAIFRPGLAQAAERKNIEKALELLEMFDLYRLRNDYANQLSGGQKRLLELARAWMTDPLLLLLDEPMAAISPVLINTIGRHLQDMRASGVTILLVEHNLRVVEELCDRVTVMIEGRAVASGSMAELRARSTVIDAYLGRLV
jgi:ABC-type branched-subunit amino acid transport system ATPase component